MLSFYDHHRQSYHHLEIREKNAEPEFVVGDYGEPDKNQGLGPGGEFMVYLYRFDNRRFVSPTKPLTTQLQVFGDAHGSLREFIACGALEAIEKAEIWSRDDLTAVLLGAGLYDRSDYIATPDACQCCFGSGYAKGIPRGAASSRTRERES
mgnify:CR=1 FL=1